MGEVSWVFSMKIPEGQRQALEALIAEMSEHVHANEPGALVYEFTISEDSRRGQVHERYADSEAGLTHLKSFNANFAERMMAIVEPAGMLVFGEPDEALKKALDMAGSVYMQPAGGFRR